MPILWVTTGWARPTDHPLHNWGGFWRIIQGSRDGSWLCVDHSICQALVSGDVHVPLTSWRDGYHLTRYWGDARVSYWWVARDWEGEVRLEWVVFHRPPNLVSHPHENKSILARMRIRVSWLQARFRGPLAADATSNVVQQHARYHDKNTSRSNRWF